ncbi:MAG: M20/M25/M40 family metallo-hydrolase, partial [Deltaproteobacteria bacterium]|nr:M20/M25/M40 family metallo-hydrolase [Deltaproteobacteria bacterium]
MKQFKSNLRLGFVYLLSIFAIVVSVAGAQDAQNLSEAEVLARVEVTGKLNKLRLPVYAHLQNATGKDYALVITSVLQLNEARVSYEILDPITVRDDGKFYMIAMMVTNDAREEAATTVDVLHDDGYHIIARVSDSEAEQLLEFGFELALLNETPLVLREATQRFLAQQAVDYNADVAEMIDSVNRGTVYEYMEYLTGERPVEIDGSDYTIATRHTNSGTPIEKATQYVFEFMQELGLSVEYHGWESGSLDNRNVIGEKTGSKTPEEIVLITAHLDSAPSGELAPGADDNASGSVGVMMAAEILVMMAAEILSQSQYEFERTVRFVFFTGEEQGLRGSDKYASKVVEDGDNVVAVYNMDMIAWDVRNKPKLRIYTRAKRDPGHDGDMVIANTFVDVVDTYALDTVLIPVITPKGGHWGGHWSDHASFWDEG